MRIVHVDPAPTWRGGERQVLLLANELARQGHENTVVAAPNSPLLDRAGAAGHSAHAVAIRGDLDFRAIGRLRRAFRELRPDVVHLHTSRAHGAGGIAARLERVRPVVVTRRLELPVTGVSRLKYRWLADHYIAISRAVRAEVLRAGVPEDRVSLIPSGVPLRADEGEASKRSSPRPFTVGTLAAFTPQKAPEVWLDVVRRVAAEDAEIRFLWAGEGELRAATMVGTAEAGLSGRVEFPGFLADPEEFWRRIDLFFLPSAFEALGTVFLDALSRGIPVVATPVGGIPEVVRSDVDGFLVSSPSDLAEHVLRVRRDPALARTLGESGRRRARDFAIEDLALRVASLYEALRERAV